MFEHFDWTVKFGDVLTLCGAVFVGGSFLYRRGGADAESGLILGRLTDEITELKTEFKLFAATLRQVAVQESKIELLMKWYDELRRGIGKIEV